MRSSGDIVVVHPGGRAAVYQSLASTLAAIEPPVWAGLLTGFARRNGLSATILDCDADELDGPAAAARLDDLRPSLVVVVAYGHQPSASTQTMPAVREVCAALKRRNPAIKILLAGGHVAALPERSLREEPVDFVAGGEGPWTLLDLARALAEPAADFRAVRGLWYRDGEAIRAGPAAPLIEDLDRALPGPPWELLPMARYRAHNWHCFGEGARQPYAALYTTLGCPYHCAFCCIQAPFHDGERALGLSPTINSYRFWSPAAVGAQLEHLAERYAVRHVKIADEMFVLNPRHVKAVCDEIARRRLDLNLWAYARIDTLQSDRMIDDLKRAGFNWLAIGIESASPRVRDAALKPFDQDLIAATVARVRAAGINIIANFVFGLPEDDPSTMQATLDLALDLQCEFVNFYCAMAYPGSALYEDARRRGWELPAGWSGYSQHAEDTLPLATRALSGADILRFRDEAWQKYFSNPAYLAMMERKFGADVSRHIRDMASHRLRRTLDDRGARLQPDAPA